MGNGQAVFQRVGVFGKPRTEGARVPQPDVLIDIARVIEAGGATPMFEAGAHTALAPDVAANYPAHDIAAIGAQADVAVVLGGDGTMLGIARELAPYGVPLIGINHGRLGFMTDIAIDAMPQTLSSMLAGRYERERRILLQAVVLRAGAEVFHASAVNDVVISRGIAGGMVEFTVRVDGVTMYNQRGDGIILATPTGSTAYALSASGPILHPNLSGLVLVPVAPQTLSNRPIALPDHCVIEMEITDVRDASAHFDMQSLSTLLPGDIVRVRRSDDAVTLLHPIGYNYFATLRQKLHWNVMPGEPHARA